MKKYIEKLKVDYVFAFMIGIQFIIILVAIIGLFKPLINIDVQHDKFR